ncbi:hypothetical protein DAEQUDRAFT_613302 [Daedalea quercina L-15889]|uniref:Uncharacterized protein n=1 Tax=Daedalea quercina L-15889 TaxID=1314783 RepID=A0A165LGS7_9APHY|nr:hypothetical protein DAEQUDRAFT_613302 [Daedalea quercina L-15889]
MTRRRSRAQPTPMTQSAAILPIFSSPRPLPSQQSYLGENYAAPTGAVRQEAPPAYHGKEPLEGETVISADAPPAQTEMPPAYVTPALALPPPAYVRDNDTRQPDQAA